MSAELSQARFRRFTAAFLVYTVAVILWGAYVRVSFSGDGCGDSWPTCRGEVVPTAPALETLIELTHRVTSGLAWIGALVLAVWASRAFPRGHRARRGGWLSLLLMTTEALVGAGLVLYQMVAESRETDRGYWMAAHLLNTFALLWALTMTWWWARGGGRLRSEGRGALAALLGFTIVGVLVLGVSGAIAALGDTLFPARSLAEGILQDFSPTAHVFLRLRALHPTFALAVGALFLVTASRARESSDDPTVRRLALVAGGLYVAQVGLGLLNLFLLAPAWMQIVHLLAGDLVWIALILLTAAALADTDLDRREVEATTVELAA